MEHLSPKRLIFSPPRRLIFSPSDWELVCRDTNKNNTVLADRVLCFDITDEGQIVFSDGTRVFHLTDGKKVELASGSIIQQIAVVDTSNEVG